MEEENTPQTDDEDEEMEDAIANEQEEDSASEIGDNSFDCMFYERSCRASCSPRAQSITSSPNGSRSP